MICYQFQITAFKLNQRNGVTVQKTTMKEMSCKRLPEINVSAKNDFLTQGWSFFLQNYPRVREKLLRPS